MADLEARGVKVEPLTLQKFTRGCGQLIVDVTAGAVRHRGQDILDDAVRAARVKVTTRESWRWAGPNIAPLTAVTFALHGFSSGPPSYDVMKSLW
jgi:hypothetical protein